MPIVPPGRRPPQNAIARRNIARRRTAHIARLFGPPDLGHQFLRTPQGTTVKRSDSGEVVFAEIACIVLTTPQFMALVRQISKQESCFCGNGMASPKSP